MIREASGRSSPRAPYLSSMSRTWTTVSSLNRVTGKGGNGVSDGGRPLRSRKKREDRGELTKTVPLLSIRHSGRNVDTGDADSVESFEDCESGQ